MVTLEKHAFLGVLTADCVPVLFVAPEKKIVAAVHAGWRGSLAGIGAKTVRLFFDQHGILPEAVEAAIGPAIGACCYEVKENVLSRLIDHWGKIATECVEHREGKTFLDLRRLNRLTLEQAGVPAKQIFDVGPCTSCAVEDFFSYRRERKATGRQISFIGWAS